MATLTRGDAAHLPLGTILLRAGVVLLTLATAAIHASLGGMLFLANAAGYTVLAVAMVAPGLPARWRWMVRLALTGFTAVTIVGWVAIGPRFGLAYVDKAIEVALIGGLVVEQWRSDGGPLGVVRHLRRLLGTVSHWSIAGNAR